MLQNIRSYVNPTELADDILARELSGLPKGAPPPPDFGDRVRSRYDALGRAGAGYLAHLALERAEARDDHLLPWLNLATELVDLAPVAMGADGTATASIHVRRSRLQQLLAPRPREAAPAPAPSSPPPKKRRWFGG
jgi:hypothetical protein